MQLRAVKRSSLDKYCPAGVGEGEGEGEVPWLRVETIDWVE